MKNFQRARSAEQKLERQNQIIEATEELYETKSYMDISLMEIAKKLDFTRGNMYKYYKSKDEIFLDILARDLYVWKDEVINKISSKRQIATDEFARIWSESIYRNRRMLELLCILNTVIEKNVSIDKLAEFKKIMYSIYVYISECVKKQFTTLSEKDIQMFYDFQMRYAVGLYPAITNNDVQREAIKMSGIPVSREEFVPTYADFIHIVLNGILQK